MDAKTLELQQRFKAIQKSLGAVTDPELAFCAGSAAWLMAIEYTIGLSMDVLAAPADQGPMHPRHKEFKEEMRQMLMAFHEEICQYLDQDTEQAIKLSHHWDQLLIELYQRK